jgi:hypothetical protein
LVYCVESTVRWFVVREKYCWMAADSADKGWELLAQLQVLPVATLDWVISSSTCPIDGSAPECLSAHSSCSNSTARGHGGYICECVEGYLGNPYIIDGCKGTTINLLGLSIFCLHQSASSLVF